MLKVTADGLSGLNNYLEFFLLFTVLCKIFFAVLCNNFNALFFLEISTHSMEIILFLTNYNEEEKDVQYVNLIFMQIQPRRYKTKGIKYNRH